MRSFRGRSLLAFARAAGQAFACVGLALAFGVACGSAGGGACPTRGSPGSGGLAGSSSSGSAGSGGLDGISGAAAGVAGARDQSCVQTGCPYGQYCSIQESNRCNPDCSCSVVSAFNCSPVPEECRPAFEECGQEPSCACLASSCAPSFVSLGCANNNGTLTNTCRQES